MKTTEECNKMLDVGHIKVTDVPLRLRQFLFVNNVFVICPYIINRNHTPRDNDIGPKLYKCLYESFEVAIAQI